MTHWIAPLIDVASFAAGYGSARWFSRKPEVYWKWRAVSYFRSGHVSIWQIGNRQRTRVGRRTNWRRIEP